MDHNYVFICSTEPLHTKNTFRELDFRVIQVLTDSSGTSRYGDSWSLLKNRKIGALTYKSELAVTSAGHCDLPLACHSNHRGEGLPI